jgi:hypothetical protein
MRQLSVVLGRARRSPPALAQAAAQASSALSFLSTMAAARSLRARRK